MFFRDLNDILWLHTQQWTKTWQYAFLSIYSKIMSSLKCPAILLCFNSGQSLKKFRKIKSDKVGLALSKHSSSSCGSLAKLIVHPSFMEICSPFKQFMFTSLCRHVKRHTRVFILIAEENHQCNLPKLNWLCERRRHIHRHKLPEVQVPFFLEREQFPAPINWILLSFTISGAVCQNLAYLSSFTRLIFYPK